MAELWKLDGVELAAALDAGEIASADIVESALARVEDVEPKINAFAYLDASGARAAAAASDARRAGGESLGPLDGVPYSVKDNIFAAGMPATWGSKLWQSLVPERDDISVERMNRAGAVNLGKTNTPEFAASGYTANDLFGVTRNPFDLSLTPGGSSGGSTASVASGVSPYALGTDAGGSIRLPASITGLYGLRPTTGAVARAFGFPPLAFDFQAIGLLTRTLADLLVLFEATSGPDVRDPASLFVPARHGRTIGLKVGWFDRIDGAPVDDQVADRVSQAAALLARGGHRVEEAAPPYDLELFGQIWPMLSPIGALIGAASAPEPDEKLTEVVAGLVESATKVTAEMYGRAMNQVLEARRRVSHAWGETDVFLLPSTCTAAWGAEEPAPTVVAGRPVGGEVLSAYTAWVNVMGYPALSVPVLPYADGRPIGVQLVARPGQEASLFTLAECLLDLYPTGTVPVEP
jgi:aspartyl-tRNA(Asn)/glutamyl-tRNA(Gln) amidotransferase subunit A